MAATPAWSPYLAYGAIPVLLGAQAWDRLRSTGAARAGPRLFLRLPRSLRTCLCTTYGWDDPIAIVNDIEADVQQALRNHEQAGRAGAIKVFRRAVSWMRIRAEELRQALR